ncbi:MAG: Lrp/AsnC ligand binding domain-containing protein [Actinomycetota bacterium]
MDAYVLIETDMGTRPIAGSLRAVPGVLFAQDVSGPYDALALARSDPDGEALRQILAQVRAFPGVIRALAAPVVRSQAGRPDRVAA